MHALSRARIVAIALLLPLTAAVTATTTQPAQALGGPLEVGRLLTDVDGDGTYDTVRLSRLGLDLFQLFVVTTKGAEAETVFTSQLEGGMEARQVLYGAATLDGVKGSEVMVRLYARNAAGYVSEPVAMAAYTWRSGTLVAQKAPAATFLKGWHMGITAAGHAQGYRFFRSHGRRYVDVSDLKWKGKKYVGKATRSVWKRGGWVKVSKRNLTVKHGFLSPYLGYGGDPVLLGVARTDIDGDAAADELRYYRYVDDGNGSGRYKVKVTTATGKVVSKKLAATETDPLVGAGELDAAPGAELVFETSSEDPVWRVLTWREGKLTTERAPVMCGSKAGATLWIGCGDQAGTGLAFSTKDGKRYVEVAGLHEDAISGAYSVTTHLSVWQGGAWVFVSSASRPLTDPEWAGWPRGFTSVPLIKP